MHRGEPDRSVNREGGQNCIFWGKFLRDSQQCLPLVAHCLDVAMVFRGLCDLPAIRRSLLRSTACQLSTVHFDRLAVLAMLHDAGKANLGFQRKVFDAKSPPAGHIRELAPLLDPEVSNPELTQAFLESLPEGMEAWFADDQSAYSYLLASFSHHGEPVKFKGERADNYWQAVKWWRPEGELNPMSAIAEIGTWARTAFPLAFSKDASPLPSEPSFHHRFAGLVTLADWLGSHPHWFPVTPVDPASRLQDDRQVVPNLLRAVGLDVTDLRGVLAKQAADFRRRFGFQKLTPLQAAIEKLPVTDDARLLIAESETGSGKTEVALHWFFKLFAEGKVDSMYFALPTRVAARELYTRVHRYVETWFRDPQTRPVTVLAVPGYAQVDGMPAKTLLPPEREANRWQDEEKLQRRERQWAVEHPKRFLAATVAVGTIDQALLSIIQTAHAHLRSVCLDRSLLVVDEVHASDFYMSSLLKHLLTHHLGVGGWAMLLSATLGSRARQRYLAAATKELPTFHAACAVPFPSLTLLDGKPRAVGSDHEKCKQIVFELLPLAFNPEALAERIFQALQAGARTLVVVNTVSRANKLLRALEAHPQANPEWFFAWKNVVCPHHGRFAPADRTVLDAEVSRRFGAKSPSGPVLLVGTQTLEQSLDIDADFLITDLAPADVLLQRVGRLHRHRRPARPQGYEEPRCVVLVPPKTLHEALDDRGRVYGAYKELGFGSVYEDVRILELTRRLLEQRERLVIPRDNRYVVESVTHPESLRSLVGERWVRHGETIEGTELVQGVASASAVASFEKFFGDFEFHEMGGQVATRLGTHSFQLPLDTPIASPFGQTIDEILIPGHLAPAEDKREDLVTVEGTVPATGEASLRWGDRRYRYSRYGLEGI